MNLPYFSFITATYNRATLIENTIVKMLSQTFKDFEIILIDDGSTDETQKLIIEKFGSDRRLKYIYQENLERGAARNTGIRNASGKYLVFVDSDDAIDINHLEKLHYNISRLDEPNFISAKYNISDGGRFYDAPIVQFSEGWYDYRLLLQGNVLGMYCAVKRENPNLVYFEENRAYSIMEDWMFNFVNLKNDRIYLTSDITYHLTNHPDRSMLIDHEKVILRKRNAKDWIIRHVELDEKEIKEIEIGSLLFESIHFYLGNFKKEAFQSLFKLIKSDQFKSSYFLLAIKILLGKNIVNKFKTLFY